MLTGAQAWATVDGPLTSGMVGIPVTIEYDDAWDGLRKNLMCRCSPWGSNDGEIRTLLNVGDTSTVAHEVMQPNMYLYLGVEGFNNDGALVIPTTWARCGIIEYGANTGADLSTDPDLPIWNQLQTEVEQIKRDGYTQEQIDEIQAYVQSAVQAASNAERSKDNAVAASNVALSNAASARNAADTAQASAENASTSASSAANLANGALQAQRAAEAAAERAETAASTSLTLTSPDGSEWSAAVTDGGELYAVKKGGGSSGEEEGGTSTVTLATNVDYIYPGFIRSTGVESPNSATYEYTDYIDVSGCTSITVNATFKASAVSPAVWYDADKQYISGETFEGTVNTAFEVTYPVPEGAKYLRSSAYTNADAYTVTITGTKTGSGTGESGDSDESAGTGGAGKLSVVYISPNGADTNSGVSAETAVATFGRAAELIADDGELIVCEGDYENPSVDLGAFSRITASGEARLIYHTAKFTAAAQVDGYTRIYSVAYNTAPNSSLWQHDYPDPRTEIAFADRHPVYRGRTHRMPTTRIADVTGVDSESTTLDGYLATMEAATDNYLYYYDADSGTLYFTAPSADFAAYPIIRPARYSIGAAKEWEVVIRGLQIFYNSLSTANLSGSIEDVCVYGAVVGGCIRWDNSRDLVFLRCEAAGADNDGFNGHGSGHVILQDCWGHDCIDDAESCHDNCDITVRGGLFEHCGSGCTPATGGRGEYFGAMVRHCTETGFSAQGVDAVIACNSCVALDIGMAAFNCGGNATATFVNCGGRGGKAFSGGNQYGCYTVE